MSLLSLAEFARKLETAALAVDAAETAVLSHAAKTVEAGAKDQIGHYAAAEGPFAAWAPLAESTLADKRRRGYAPPDNPLLRTGEMRDSIEHTVRAPQAWVGSNSDIAVYQELGTATIPPRSFLGSTAFRLKDQIGKEIGYGIVQSLIAGRVNVAGD